MDKKAEILLAANDCFLKYGYSKTSMSDIGKIVHLNKASLYYHYKDKLTLYTEVVMMHRKKYLWEVEDLMKVQSTIIDKILTFIQAEIKFSQQTSRMLTNSNHNIYDTKLETKSVYEAIIETDIKRLADLIQEGVAQNEFLPCDAITIATLIMKTTDGILNVNCPLFLDEELRNTRYNELSVELRLIVTLLLNGLKVPQNC